jgi:hypothetical protein
MPFVDLAGEDPLRFGYLNMKRIWNNYKVWIIIGLAYSGFSFFKGYKVLKQMVSILYRKLASVQSLLTKESL